MKAINGMLKAFDAGTLMALHLPPGSGKITVMREIATLLRGISIIVMPTLALAGGDPRLRRNRQGHATCYSPG
jgi:ABC-type multidrug transport system ATPase subunit